MLPLLLLAALLTQAPLAVGRISNITCEADATQSYVLYLPAAYTPDRAWPVILAFDPAGRGRAPVERYQAAAERYGYVVVGSNNSRNGAQALGQIVSILTTDVFSRVHVDPRRVYAAGMSGGARVALSIAIGSRAIAGVIASSAGYPDGEARKRLPFPVFATAGTEDFNHLEMRLLDRALSTPHHLAIFEGGHTWLPTSLATEAIEWMQLQAMKSGIAPRNDSMIGELLATRIAAAEKVADPGATYLAWQSIAEDFQGVKDVTAIAERAAALAKNADVRAALRKDRDDDDREQRLLEDVRTAEMRLSSGEERAQALAYLRQQWKTLSEKSKSPTDTRERRLARRVSAGLSAAVTTTDPDYLKIIAEFRSGRGRLP